MITAGDIYSALDAAAPFSAQEAYDNSGLLVGDREKSVKKVLLALDITKDVVQEAADLGADLIISHHPVIWGGIKAIDSTHPVWHLIFNDIAAICSHTCMDVAPAGTNAAIGELLAKHLALGDITPLEQLSGGRTLGCVADLTKPVTVQALADVCYAVFGCEDVRCFCPAESIGRIAWCGGSGGDLLGEAQAAGADILITGDVKHSVWCEAVNRSIGLMDCGHCTTELPVLERFRVILQDAFPHLEITESKAFAGAPYTIY
ncbi:MAG: Nif3-like dinuclear metal center hexameric protein [Oscillospiraceae bacterium]|nr:Nif3-like dinuclear metal center hexameric protein [Oscillospiraceae bacterium]